jgi:type IV pilus assembly protein PilO
MNIDLKEIGANLAGQFEGLQGRPPGQWPIAPRLLCAAAVMVAVIAAGYFFYWQGQFDELESLANQEVTLRADYRSKLAQAVNLEALQEQKAQVDLYVERLQKQLPSKAEMAALLSDINQAGIGRGLAFELFKPGQVVVRDYYAELPIDIKVTGNYHDINNMTLTTVKDGSLSLDAVAKTFRYLDQDEAAAQRKLLADKKKGAKPGSGAKP